MKRGKGETIGVAASQLIMADSPSIAEVSASKESVELANAFGEGVGLSFSFRGHKLTKDVVIRDLAAAQRISQNGSLSLDFPVSLPHGWTVSDFEPSYAREDASCSLICDAQGKPTLRVLAPRVMDAQGIEHAGVKLDWVTEPDTLTLRKSLNMSRLETLSFPVCADATFEWIPETGLNDLSAASFGAGSTSYSSARAASTGSINSYETTISVGQEIISGTPDHYKLHRGLLDFQTSALGANATITSASLDLYCSGGTSGSYAIDVCEWTDGANGPDSGDFAAYTSLSSPTIYGSLASASFTSSAYSSITLSNTGVINGGGHTYLMLRSSDDVGDTAPTAAYEVLEFSTREQSVSEAPKLIVNFTLPDEARERVTPTRMGGAILEAPQNATMGGESVYLHSGEFRHDISLLSIPGRMNDIGVSLTYRTFSTWDGPMGLGWTGSFLRRVHFDESSDEITYYSGDGRIDVFTNSGSAGIGPYTKAGFFFDFLVVGGGNMIQRRGAHGSNEYFQPQVLDENAEFIYRTTSVVDRFGNTSSYTYNDSGQLSRIDGDRSGSTDHYIEFTYNGDGRLESINDYADYTAQQSVIGSSYTGERKWEFTYDIDGHLTTIWLPKTENFDSAGTGSDARTRIEFDYDGSDRMTEIFDARQAGAGSSYGWLRNNYDGSSRVEAQDVGRTSVSDTTHRSHLVYGGSGVVDSVDAMGLRTRFAMNGDGTLDKLREYTGEWNSSLTQTASAIRGSDPTYYESSFDYDAQFNLIEATPPLGNAMEYLYDITNGDQRSRSNLQRILQRPDSTRSGTLPSDQEYGLLWTFNYSSANDFNLLTHSVSSRAYSIPSSWNIDDSIPTPHDASDFITEYVYLPSTGSYGPRGALRYVIQPTIDATLSPGTPNSGQSITITFEHNSFGQLSAIEDGLGVRTEYTYGTSGDEYGYLTDVSQGAQSTYPINTELDYNSVGAAIGFTDGRGYVWTSYVNQLGQVVRSDTPQVSYHGNVVLSTTFEYDLNGNMLEVNVPNLDETGSALSPATITTEWQYNSLDQATSVTTPISTGLNATTQWAYDLNYRQVLTTLPEGNQAATDFDELNRVYKTYWGFDTTNVAKGSALEVREFNYDLNSNLLSATDGRGNSDASVYDGYDRVVETSDRLSTNPSSNEYQYNREHQLTQAERYGLLYEYNVGSDSFSAATGELLSAREYRYDNSGRRYQMKRSALDHFGSDLGYDGLSGDGDMTLTLKYLNNGLLDRLFDDQDSVYSANDYVLRYHYDDFNRVEAIEDSQDAAGTNNNLESYTYDDNSNLTAVQARLWDPVNSSFTYHTTSFVYDSLDRMVQDQSPPIAGSGSLYRSYRYDSRSNLVQTTDRKGVVRRYTYDLMDRFVMRSVQDVEQWNIAGWQDPVDLDDEDVEGLIEYDRNSNVVRAIDATGNATETKYDLAQRWLQTVQPDAVTGFSNGALNTAGSGHTLTAVGSSVFFSKSGAYDGNGNLLIETDHNETEVEYTYDENDLLIDIDADTSGAASNGFTLEGEDHITLQWDGAYRLVRGETFEAAAPSSARTRFERAFNSLSLMERERQTTRYDTAASYSSDVVSAYDELGRRYTRNNPRDVRRVRWQFDRKHRPVTMENRTWNGSSWSAWNEIASYKYRGGGLLRREVKRTMEADS